MSMGFGSQKLAFPDLLVFPDLQILAYLPHSPRGTLHYISKQVSLTIHFSPFFPILLSTSFLKTPNVHGTSVLDLYH